MLPDANVTSLIPQRAPFVMIDELVFADATVTRTRLVIRDENLLVENGFFTEAGLVENMAQTAAAGAGYQAKTENGPVLVGFITVVKNLIIYSLPEVGQELLTQINIQDQVFNTTLITGEVYSGNVLIAGCEMSILIDPAQQN